LRVTHRTALKEAIEAVFANFTVQELAERFRAKNVPCGRVRSIGEAIEHPQVAARDILLVQQHPQIGPIETLAPVVRLSRTPADVRLPPPALGEHTAEVLGDLKSRV
jgi:crotonobetainyl-CoA:carnitine CoA-transferase CaiB-like acyl-CoA transferase